MIKTIDILGERRKAVVETLSSKLGICPIFDGENNGFCNSYYIVHFPSNNFIARFTLRDTPVKALRHLRKLNWDFYNLVSMPDRTRLMSRLIIDDFNTAEAEIIHAFCTIEKYFGVTADVLITLAQNHGRTTRTTCTNSHTQKSDKIGR